MLFKGGKVTIIFLPVTFGPASPNLDQNHGLRVGRKLIAEVRVGNANQGLSPFASGFSAQVDAPIFGHNVLDVHPGVGGHLHAWHDARDRGVLGRGLQPDEGLAPFEKEEPLTKSNCPPDPLYSCPLMNSAFTWP
jgi:hypothetical protein